MTTLSHLLKLSFVLCLLFTTSSYAQEFDVVIDAGHVDRHNSVVSFDWPESLSWNGAGLYDANGQEIAIQYYNKKGWFILDTLQSGDQASFVLKNTTSSDFGAIGSSFKDNGAIGFSLNGSTVLQYNSAETELPRKNIKKKFKRGGYIHPVNTPSGITITDDYPRNHTHHHGIWAAWTKTEFDGREPDFWNMGNLSGTVLPTGLDTTWTGPVIAGTKSKHVYVDLSADEPVDVLNESWEINVFSIPTDGPKPYYLFDLHVLHETATDKPLHLPEYRYGGIGFRGHWDWNGANKTFFLTSEGKDRSNGHATRADWCHISGFVDGSLAGVAILSHPDNFRHPQPMRIHPSEPFFNWAPSQAGDWSITPDQPYKVTYRFVVMDGEPDSALYDRLWQDFATPPSASLSPR